MIGLHFNYYKHIEIKEARQLLLSSVDIPKQPEESVFSGVSFAASFWFSLTSCSRAMQFAPNAKICAASWPKSRPFKLFRYRFLQVVNKDPRLRPYLVRYPFRADNIEIAIFLTNPDSSDVDAKDLSIVSIKNGILRYDVDDPNGKLFLTIHSETYEEALRKSQEIGH